MKKIDAVIEVMTNGDVKLELEESVAPGRHKAYLIVDDAEYNIKKSTLGNGFVLPTIDFGKWFEDVPLRRCDIYDERGR
jgi:hypothetical protein